MRLGPGGDPGEDQEGSLAAIRPAVVRQYRRRGTRSPEEFLNLLQDRVEDYKATVVRCRAGELPEAIARRLAARTVAAGEATRLVIPSELPGGVAGGAPPAELVVLRDLEPETLSNAQLASAHGVLTGCALAIAETGTLVLDGGPTQGRRVLTLLPDYHLCVVFAASGGGDWCPRRWRP